MATPYLAITDGTETVLIANNATLTNYLLERDVWGPSIAGLRATIYAGRSPYNDVEEEISLHIRGATAAAAYANLDVLVRLLNQAELWAKGANVAPVLIKYAPQGSTISSDTNPLTSAILGRTSRDTTSGVTLPQSFSEAAQTYQITGVDTSFKRRGLWHGTSQSKSASAAQSGDLMSVAAFTDNAKTPSPIKVSLTNYRSTSGGFLMLANDTNKFYIENATTVLFTGSTVANSTARDGNIRRHTANNIVDTFKAFLTLPAAFKTAVSRVRVFATVAVSGAATWTVNLNNKTRSVHIEPTAGDKKAIWIGDIDTSVVSGIVTVTFTTDSRLVGDSIDFDYFVCTDAHSPQITLFPRELEPSEATQTDTLVIDHRVLTKPTPQLMLGTRDLPYRGNIHMTHTGTSIAGLLMLTEGANWRDYTGTTVPTHALTVERTLAYTTPQ